MRYISTRSEAPALGFVEATLAGLARDGGLYVPAAWPRLDADTIAGFAGRPMRKWRWRSFVPSSAMPSRIATSPA